MDDLRRFDAARAADPAFARAAQESATGPSREAAAAAFAAFARSRGYAVTVEDLLALRPGGEVEGELADADLDRVAGGAGHPDLMPRTGMFYP